MTTISIVHEAETQRQHARLRVPAYVKIEGRRLEVRELSVGGVGLPRSDVRLHVGQRVRLSLDIPFDDFALSFDLAGEVRHPGAGERGPGLLFVDLSRRQVSMLQHLINSYLCGQLVRVGDLFDIAGRDAFVGKRKQTADDEQQVRGVRSRLRRIIGYATIGVASIALFGFIATSLMQRIFVTEAAGALSSRSAAIVRSPAGGLIHELMVQPGDFAETGVLLAVIETALGDTAMVHSPCDCLLATTFVVGGQYVQVNEALMALTPESAAQVVVIYLPLETARGITPGDVALVDFYDGAESMSGYVARILPESIDPTGYAGRTFESEPMARIEITLEEAQPLARLGEPVAVRISSLPSLSSWFSASSAE